MGSSVEQITSTFKRVLRFMRVLGMTVEPCAVFTLLDKQLLKLPELPLLSKKIAFTLMARAVFDAPFMPNQVPPYPSYNHAVKMACADPNIDFLEQPEGALFVNVNVPCRPLQVYFQSKYTADVYPFLDALHHFYVKEAESIQTSVQFGSAKMIQDFFSPIAVVDRWLDEEDVSGLTQRYQQEVVIPRLRKKLTAAQEEQNKAFNNFFTLCEASGEAHDLQQAKARCAAASKKLFELAGLYADFPHRDDFFIWLGKNYLIEDQNIYWRLISLLPPNKENLQRVFLERMKELGASFFTVVNAQLETPLDLARKHNLKFLEAELLKHDFHEPVNEHLDLSLWNFFQGLSLTTQKQIFIWLSQEHQKFAETSLRSLNDAYLRAEAMKLSYLCGRFKEEIFQKMLGIHFPNKKENELSDAEIEQFKTIAMLHGYDYLSNRIQALHSPGEPSEVVGKRAASWPMKEQAKKKKRGGKGSLDGG